MNPEKLDVVCSLKFQDKIKINGKLLFRGNWPHDFNTQDNYWEYEFYTDWDKGKNLLPKHSHLVKVYTSFKKKIKNGKEIFEVDNYLRGVLKDLGSGKEEKIKSIE